jgi:hypothetical protein
MARTASARVTVNVGGLQPPPQAAAAGYTRLAFNEDFNDTSGIDMANSRAPGFKWYRFKPWGFSVLNNQFSVANSICTFNPTTSEGYYTLGSTCGKPGNTFIGFAAEHGAYFEASIRHPVSASSSGWPAWWSMSTDHVWEGVDNNFWEPDFYEKIGSTGQYITATHAWSTPSTQSNRFDDTITHGGDFTVFNSYGMLWVPGNRYAYYLNDTLKSTRTYASNPWLSGGDNKKWPLILGTGAGWTMHVDWVRVWQAPT